MKLTSKKLVLLSALVSFVATSALAFEPKELKREKIEVSKNLKWNM